MPWPEGASYLQVLWPALRSGAPPLGVWSEGDYCTCYDLQCWTLRDTFLVARVMFVAASSFFLLWQTNGVTIYFQLFNIKQNKDLICPFMLFSRAYLYEYLKCIWSVRLLRALWNVAMSFILIWNLLASDIRLLDRFIIWDFATIQRTVRMILYGLSMYQSFT